ncbi:MAG: hypothetical protein V4691_02485 [Pseudomonadota bacterium]
MTEEVIPEDVRNFVMQKIDSVAQLECLLLLRAKPKDRWSAQDTAKNLYISEEKANELLQQLAVQGLFKIENPSLFYYQPASENMRDTVDRLAIIYSKYLLPVTHLIHSKSKTRIKEFADAFRIRKD